MKRAYHVQHPAFDVFDMFIVPVHLDQRGFYYEAIFNRLQADVSL